MKDNSSNNKVLYNTAKQDKFNYFLIPIIIILTIVPLVTRLHLGFTDEYQYVLGVTKRSYADVFLHWKSIIVAIVAAVMVPLGIRKYIQLDNIEKKQFIKRTSPILVYLFLIMLSTLLSINKYSSTHGDMDQEEPFWVLISYVILVCYSMLVAKTEKDFRIILHSGILGSFLVSLIVILMYLGINPFEFPLINSVVFPKRLLNLVNYSYTEDLKIAGTLYNPNYVGPYVSLFIPFSLVAIVYEKKIWQKIIGILNALLLCFALYVSKTKAGMIIVFLTILFILFFLFKMWISKWYIVLAVSLMLIAAFLLTDKLLGNTILDPIHKGLSSIVAKEEYSLKGIDTTKNYVKILYEDYDLRITYEQILGQTMYDLNVTCMGNKLRVTEMSNGGLCYIILPNDEYLPITLTQFDELCFGFTIYNEKDCPIDIIKDTNNDYKVINTLGFNYESRCLSTSLLDGKEAMASGRGYIWRTALNSFPDYLFIGAGPDCYPYAVNNKCLDSVAKSRKIVDIDSQASRPHSYYLQMSINTGFISLICCLVFFSFYIIDCFKIYFNKKTITTLSFVGIGFFASVIGFLGCGLTNDSLVVVSPCFWIILGCGVNLNCYIKKHNK